MSDGLEGKPLPAATLQSSGGGSLSLPADLQGKWTVIYTYPKDDTPGCTKEACSFRDNKAEFEAIGAQIFGLSGDDMDSHKAFIGKYQLSFPLLSDPQAVLTGPLGAYGDQEWNGKVYKGLSRDTFLVDPQGVVRKVWRKVNPLSTISEAYEEIKRLQNV